MGVRLENGTCNLWVYEIEHRDLSYSFQHAAISEFLASVFCKHRSKAWTISTNPWAVTRLVCYGMFISAWPVTSSIYQFLKNSTTRLTFFRWPTCKCFAGLTVFEYWPMSNIHHSVETLPPSTSASCIQLSHPCHRFTFFSTQISTTFFRTWNTPCCLCSCSKVDEGRSLFPACCCSACCNSCKDLPITKRTEDRKQGLVPSCAKPWGNRVHEAGI